MVETSPGGGPSDQQPADPANHPTPDPATADTSADPRDAPVEPEQSAAEPATAAVSRPPPAPEQDAAGPQGAGDGRGPATAIPSWLQGPVWQMVAALAVAATLFGLGMQFAGSGSDGTATDGTAGGPTTSLTPETDADDSPEQTTTARETSTTATSSQSETSTREPETATEQATSEPSDGTGNQPTVGPSGVDTTTSTTDATTTTTEPTTTTSTGSGWPTSGRVSGLQPDRQTSTLDGNVTFYSGDYVSTTDSYDNAIFRDQTTGACYAAPPLTEGAFVYLPAGEGYRVEVKHMSEGFISLDLQRGSGGQAMGSC